MTFCVPGPVVEVDEVDSAYSDDEEDLERQDPKFFNETMDVTDETSGGKKRTASGRSIKSTDEAAPKPDEAVPKPDEAVPATDEGTGEEPAKTEEFEGIA